MRATDLNPATAGMAEYLRGMARFNSDKVQDVAAFQGWAELAQRILDQHREDFLRGLPPDDLAAIAKGEIDLNAAAKAALGN